MTGQTDLVVTKESWIKTNIGTLIAIAVALVTLIVFIQNTRADIDKKATTTEVVALSYRVQALEKQQDINTELLFLMAKKLEIDVTDIFAKYSKLSKDNENTK